VDGFKHRFPGRRGAKANRPHHRGQEAAQAPVPVAQFGDGMIFGGHQGVDHGHGRRELIPRHSGKGGGPNLGIGQFIREQNPTGIAHRQGSIVEVA
jgi:hypothetical protein